MSSKMDFWSNHVRALDRSGGSLAAYARENDLSRSQFMYWRQKILSRAEEVIADANDFEEVTVSEDQSSGSILDLASLGRNRLYAIIQALAADGGGNCEV